MHAWMRISALLNNEHDWKSREHDRFSVVVAVKGENKFVITPVDQTTSFAMFKWKYLNWIRRYGDSGKKSGQPKPVLFWGYVGNLWMLYVLLVPQCVCVEFTFVCRKLCALSSGCALVVGLEPISLDGIFLCSAPDKVTSVTVCSVFLPFRSSPFDTQIWLIDST